MDQPFEIMFDFPLASSDLIIPLSAIAELQHPDPFYRVDDFRFADGHPHENISPVLPPIEIKQIQQESARLWVHCDSEKETLLSMIAGNAIERALQKIIVC